MPEIIDFSKWKRVHKAARKEGIDTDAYILRARFEHKDIGAIVAEIRRDERYESARTYFTYLSAAAIALSMASSVPSHPSRLMIPIPQPPTHYGRIIIVGDRDEYGPKRLC